MTQNMDGVFYKHLPDVSQLLAFVLVEGLSDVCWKLNTAEKRKCGRFLQSVEENSLTQPSRGDAPLDLCLHVEKGSWWGDMVVRGDCEHSDLEMIGEVMK